MLEVRRIQRMPPASSGRIRSASASRASSVVGRVAQPQVAEGRASPSSEIHVHANVGAGPRFVSEVVRNLQSRRQRACKDVSSPSSRLLLDDHPKRPEAVAEQADAFDERADAVEADRAASSPRNGTRPASARPSGRTAPLREAGSRSCSARRCRSARRRTRGTSSDQHWPGRSRRARTGRRSPRCRHTPRLHSPTWRSWLK